MKNKRDFKKRNRPWKEIAQRNKCALMESNWQCERCTTGERFKDLREVVDDAWFITIQPTCFAFFTSHSCGWKRSPSTNLSASSSTTELHTYLDIAVMCLFKVLINLSLHLSKPCHVKLDTLFILCRLKLNLEDNWTSYQPGKSEEIFQIIGKIF